MQHSINVVNLCRRMFCGSQNIGAFCYNHSNRLEVLSIVKTFFIFLLTNVFHKKFCSLFYIHGYDNKKYDKHYNFWLLKDSHTKNAIYILEPLFAFSL